ncbi:3618_t:CDS:1, partial [Dentiscutata heterogama]
QNILTQIDKINIDDQNISSQFVTQDTLTLNDSINSIDTINDNQNNLIKHDDNDDDTLENKRKK